MGTFDSRNKKFPTLQMKTRAEDGTLSLRPVQGMISDMGAMRSFPRHMITITQIITPAELNREGSAMNHCVASYSYNCTNGTCSIWSMRAWDGENDERLLTIELRHESRTIAQVRGVRNRKAKPEEMAMVEEWARREKLRVSGYV
jgi:hypothetical protein